MKLTLEILNNFPKPIQLMIEGYNFHADPDEVEIEHRTDKKPNGT